MGLAERARVAQAHVAAPPDALDGERARRDQVRGRLRRDAELRGERATVERRLQVGRPTRRREDGEARGGLRGPAPELREPRDDVGLGVTGREVGIGEGQEFCYGHAPSVAHRVVRDSADRPDVSRY